MILGAKPLGDTFDFSGMQDEENKRKQFVDMTDYISAKVDANPKILKDPAAVEKLTSEAFKAVAPSPIAKKEPPPVVPKKPGFFEGLLKSTPQQSKLSPEDTTASLTAAKATAEKIRDSDLPMLEKTQRLKAIRDRLKAAGISGDI